MGKEGNSKKPVLVVVDEVDGATGENVSTQNGRAVFDTQTHRSLCAQSSSFVAKLVQLTVDSRKKRRFPSPVPIPHALPLINFPGRAGQKRDPKDQPLRRPIICICNDLYANSIAKLRPICRIIRFNPASPGQLSTRLRDICDREGLQADTRGLSLLANICKGDMRGCLNTLQVGVRSMSPFEMKG